VGVVGVEAHDDESERARKGQGEEEHDPEHNASTVLGATRTGCRAMNDPYSARKPGAARVRPRLRLLYPGFG
jgi:hypothetical protein